MTKTRNHKPAKDIRPDATQQDSVSASNHAVAPRQTKAALVRALLEAPRGASLTLIMAETGWQAHTVRAALTGLRKAGLHLIRRREGDDSIYAAGAALKLARDIPGDGDDGSVEPDTTMLAPDDDRSSSAPSQLGAADSEARV